MFTQIHSSNPTFHLQLCYPSKAQLYPLKKISKFASYHSQKPLHITLAKDEGGLDSAPKQSSPPPPPFNRFRGSRRCPIGRALLLFSAIGRYNHGLSIFVRDTLRTTDPFMAGWFLSAYFLGGYSEDGRGANGLSKAVLAAAKSWGLGIPISQEALELEEDQAKGLFGRRNKKIGFLNP
ncbi:hypothetical protein GQ457_16G015630 [Hibiscus cannabinus]